VEAVDYIRDRSGVKGVLAHDRLTGAPLEIMSKFVLNAAGPWAHRLNQKILKKPVGPDPFILKGPGYRGSEKTFR
jgi:glycerol-3-phosphate dehydrogenase